VRSALAKLPAKQQSALLELYQRHTKSLTTAYLLWFFPGWHCAYLGKWGVQVLFWLAFGGLLMWWLVDLVRLPGMIRRYNEDVAVNVMRDLATIAS